MCLCDPMDCSLPGPSVHGILQARTQEWVANSFSRGISWPRNWTQVSSITGRYFTDWAMREVRAFYFLWYVQIFVNRCMKNYGNIIFLSFLKKLMLKMSILIITCFISYIHSLPLAALFVPQEADLYNRITWTLLPSLSGWVDRMRAEGNRRMTEGIGYLFSPL